MCHRGRGWLGRWTMRRRAGRGRAGGQCAVNRRRIPHGSAGLARRSTRAAQYRLAGSELAAGCWAMLVRWVGLCEGVVGREGVGAEPRGHSVGREGVGMVAGTLQGLGFRHGGTS
jgi:hypothetical protein